jgi:hypothetical protein
MRFGPGADNEGTRALWNEDGVLKLDVHSLWPKQQEIMVGTAPEFHPVEKRLFYAVRGDGKLLTEGKFGAWILGQGDIDVSVENVKRLELETKTELAKKPTLFWANARVVTREGKEIPLSELPLSFENVTQPEKPGADYFGGPIKISGNSFQTATPGEPKNAKQSAVVRVDLSGVDATRLKATIGGDYPLGDEAQRRKTYAVRSPEKSDTARFLAIIEPHENAPMIKSASALSANSLRVELTDGRVQEITMEGLDGSGQEVAVTLVETRDGKPLRTETTRPALKDSSR